MKEVEAFLPSSVFISKKKVSKKELRRQRKILKLYEKYFNLGNHDKLREIELKLMKPSFFPPVSIAEEIPKYEPRFLQIGFSDERHYKLFRLFTGDMKKTTIFLENNLWLLKAVIKHFKTEEPKKAYKKCKK